MEAAHIRSAANSGTGVKPADRYVAPLCRWCHGLQHSHGQPAFWVDLDIAFGLAEELWRHSGDQDRGVRAVLRTRQKLAQARAR